MYPELPPRVEYSLTPFGQEFVEILDRIAVLQQKIKVDGDRSARNLKHR
jgi:DNA-binding HxlR family transcriptional regulator